VTDLEAIRTPAGDPLSYRIGVTTTSPGNLEVSMITIMKTGGAACDPSSTCANESYRCECPELGFEACTAECPGQCYCEPPGSTMPMNETCDMEDGVLLEPPGSADPWIDGPADDVAATFTSVASMGTSGCSYEMPLRAAERALSSDYYSGPGEPNEGFRRPGSLLLLIILTDEDDCSIDLDVLEFRMIFDISHPDATYDESSCTDADGNDLNPDVNPVEHYVDFLDSLTAGDGSWHTTVIAGNADDAELCISDWGEAYPAYRLSRFATAAGSRGTFIDSCAADFSAAFDDLLAVLEDAF
jgi:hypothetical protein